MIEISNHYKKWMTRFFLGLLMLAMSALCYASNSTTVKNVIIMIGDGMGPQQVGLLNAYAKYAPHSIYKAQGRITAIEKAMAMGTIGYAYHEPANVLVADSAASATQFATGEHAGSEMIGCDEFGNAARTILEIARDLGKSTGLVSDTRITHATPAAFAAHQTHRSKENAIAVDMLNANVDVMLSGGLRHWIPIEANDEKALIHEELKRRTAGKIKIKSKRKDSRNLLLEAEKKHYAVALTLSELQKAQGNKILGLFSYSGMRNGIQETLTKNEPNRSMPTLKEMTIKALDVLSKNDKGFFIMIEAGQIDWAGHDNDTGALLHEMLKFDETIQYVLDWVKNREDTLLIISADHETGGFGFSYSDVNVPEATNLQGKVFEGDKFHPRFNFGNYDILDKLYNQKRTYTTLFKQFDALPVLQQTPESLVKIVNTYTQFPISLAEAKSILDIEIDNHDAHGHKHLEEKRFAKIHDFNAFYVYRHRIPQNLLARVVAKYQNTVWATGTHTNTPVPLIALGPEKVRAQFGSMLHTTEWAQYAIEALQ
jgi:alkaline phosphatase